jgi:hypothetical protein
MKKVAVVVALALLLGSFGASRELRAQDAKPSGNVAAKPAEAAAAAQDARSGQAYSGMYAFLKEGEFVQVSVDDTGRVTGFVSRFGDQENGQGDFVDQYFKSGKLEGNKLSFTTEIVRGMAFEFKGTVERGEGKNPGDEAYFVLKGTVTENTTDANRKVTSRSQDVLFKMFPQEAAK